MPSAPAESGPTRAPSARRARSRTAPTPESGSPPCRTTVPPAGSSGTAGRSPGKQRLRPKKRAAPAAALFAQRYGSSAVVVTPAVVVTGGGPGGVMARGAGALGVTAVLVVAFVPRIVVTGGGPGGVVARGARALGGVAVTVVVPVPLMPLAIAVLVTGGRTRCVLARRAGAGSGLTVVVVVAVIAVAAPGAAVARVVVGAAAAGVVARVRAFTENAGRVCRPEQRGRDQHHQAEEEGTRALQRRGLRGQQDVVGLQPRERAGSRRNGASRLHLVPHWFLLVHTRGHRPGAPQRRGWICSAGRETRSAGQ